MAFKAAGVGDVTLASWAESGAAATTSDANATTNLMAVFS